MVLTQVSRDVRLSYDNLSRIVCSNGCITYVNLVSMRADMCTVHRDSQLSRGTDCVVQKGAKQSALCGTGRSLCQLLTSASILRVLSDALSTAIVT